MNLPIKMSNKEYPFLIKWLLGDYFGLKLGLMVVFLGNVLLVGRFYGEGVTSHRGCSAAF